MASSHQNNTQKSASASKASTAPQMSKTHTHTRSLTHSHTHTIRTHTHTHSHTHTIRTHTHILTHSLTHSHHTHTHSHTHSHTPYAHTTHFCIASPCCSSAGAVFFLAAFFVDCRGLLFLHGAGCATCGMRRTGSPLSIQAHRGQWCLTCFGVLQPGNLLLQLSLPMTSIKQRSCG